MPIFHIYMPDRGLVLPSAAVNDVGELSLQMIMNGAQFHTFEPREVAVLTPPYWGDERSNDYLLMMKNSANAARLHILPRTIGSLSMQTFIDTQGTLRIEPLRTVHIPAQTDAFAIGRSIGANTEVAGLVMQVDSVTTQG